MIPPIFNHTWPDDVQALYYHDIQEIWNPKIAQHMWNQYHNQLEMYFSFTGKNRKLKILDIGCAQGTLALLLAERGHTVFAVDIRQQFLDYAASRYQKGDIHFFCGNVMEIDFSEKFDLIFANQIIEHLIQPFEFTHRLSKWLKPNGCLVVTTPNGKYIGNSLPSFSDLGDASQYRHFEFSADGDGHFFAFNNKELVQAFEKSGLQQIIVRFFETPWISGHMKLRYLHSFIPYVVLKLLDRTFLRLPTVNQILAHQLLISGRSS